MSKTRTIYLNLAYLSILVGLFSACQQEEVPYDEYDEALEAQLTQAAEGGDKLFFLLPESTALSSLPQDAKNPLNVSKVELGKRLFHETGLAIAPVKTFSRNTYSCATCHNASAGFRSGLSQGIGEGGIGFGVKGEGRYKGSLYFDKDVDVQPLRAPSLLNLAFQKNVLWSGKLGATGINAGTENLWSADSLAQFNKLGFEGIETQAIAGMSFHRLGIDRNFIENTEYKALFNKAFPNETEPYTQQNASLAIAAYVRTLVSNKSPFQLWLKDNYTAMSQEEKEGAILFFGKAGCVDCHTGPALSSMDFHAIGMDDLSPTINIDQETIRNAGLGRGEFTNRQADYYRFKVPQLYNLQDANFFGHGSSFRSIERVVRYKNNAAPENPVVPRNALSEEFRPLNLTDDEIGKIVLFLKNSLRDPQLHRYTPNEIPSGNCFPNNDPLSKSDLGCKF